MNDRRQFTAEQLSVVDALVTAHAEAARELARLTKPIEEARRAGDRDAFQAADAVHQEAHERCKALRLAIEITRTTFLKANKGEKLSGLLPES